MTLARGLARMALLRPLSQAARPSAARAGAWPGARRAFSSGRKDDDVPTPPKGISEEDLLKFLAEPEAEGSPFADPIAANARPRVPMASSESTGPKRTLPEASADMRKMVQEAVSKRPLRPGDMYDPISMLDEQLGGPGNQRQRQRRALPRPARLEVTGTEIHYMNVWFLSRFLSPFGSILSRKKTGLSATKQRRLAKAIRRARQMGLLPYLQRYHDGPLEQVAGEKEPNPLAEPVRARNTGAREGQGRRRR